MAIADEGVNEQCFSYSGQFWMRYHFECDYEMMKFYPRKTRSCSNGLIMSPNILSMRKKNNQKNALFDWVQIRKWGETSNHQYGSSVQCFCFFFLPPNAIVKNNPIYLNALSVDGLRLRLSFFSTRGECMKYFSIFRSDGVTHTSSSNWIYHIHKSIK